MLHCNIGSCHVSKDEGCRKRMYPSRSLRKKLVIFALNSHQASHARTNTDTQPVAVFLFNLKSAVLHGFLCGNCGRQLYPVICSVEIHDWSDSHFIVKYPVPELPDADSNRRHGSHSGYNYSLHFLILSTTYPIYHTMNLSGLQIWQDPCLPYPGICG